MDICRKIWSITRINLQRWKNDHRVWIIFIIVGLLVFQKMSGFREYGLDTGEKCTGYLLPVLFHGGNISIGVTKTMLYIGGLLLLCDAPFIYPMTPYMVFRSRRECWWMGECFYILLTSFLYVVFIVVVSMAAVLPVITLGDDWGNALRAFTVGDKEFSPQEIQQMYNTFIYASKNTMGRLYPIGAQMYTFLSAWASFFLLGLLQYLVSLVSKSMFLATAMSGVFVFLDPILNYGHLGDFWWLKLVSPVSWVTTDWLKLVDDAEILTVGYVVGMFALMIAVLLFFIWRVSKKIMIEVRGEV